MLQTTLFDNVTGLMSKNIKYATVHAFTEYKKEVWAFAMKEKTDQKYEQYMGYEGFGAAPGIDESGDIVPVDFEEGYKTTIPQKQWAYEVRVTWQQRRFATKAAKFAKQIGFFLGRSANLRYEYTGSDILNNGFTDTAAYRGGDAKPLFSASHPWKTGGTYSNVLASADLSKTALVNGLKTIQNAKMEQSIPAALKVKNVKIGYENLFKLPELLKSSLDPESGNNTYNAIQDFGIKKVLNHYVTDTDAWYIGTDRSHLYIVEATSPFLTTESYNNKEVGENIWMSFNNGFTVPLGEFGNAGS